MVYGICGPGTTAPAFPGSACYESNSGTPPILGQQCGLNSTCNPPATGMSIAVTGVTNNKDNGVFQVSKITNSTNIKVKVLQVNGDVTPVQLPAPGANAYATVNTGCAQ